MDLNWRAVAYGFVVTVLIGLVGGLMIPGTEMIVPALGWGLTGIIAGVVAGYVAGGTSSEGAITGGLATVIGALILLVILSFAGALFSGLIPAFGLLTIGMILLVVHAIPGAIGGALGSREKSRRIERADRPPA